MSISYSKVYFQTIKDMTRFSPQIVLSKKEGNIVINQRNADETIAFTITAPESNFGFDSETIAFFNYGEFHNFLELFTNPNIEIDKSKIILSESTSKTEYILSNPEACKVGDDIKWKNPDIRFELPQKELENFVKASSLFNSSEPIKKARIVGNGDTISIELVNININPKQKSYDKIFSKQFKVEKLSECGEYDFIVNREFFISSPKRNYTVELKKEGFLKMSHTEEGISVDILCVPISER